MAYSDAVSFLIPHPFFDMLHPSAHPSIHSSFLLLVIVLQSFHPSFSSHYLPFFLIRFLIIFRMILIIELLNAHTEFHGAVTYAFDGIFSWQMYGSTEATEDGKHYTVNCVLFACFLKLPMMSLWIKECCPPFNEMKKATLSVDVIRDGKKLCCERHDISSGNKVWIRIKRVCQNF